MSDRLDEVLKHRYVYLPRGTTKDTLQPGKLLGLAVARARRVPLTVLAPQKNSATFHAELAKLEIVTSAAAVRVGYSCRWSSTMRTQRSLTFRSIFFGMLRILPTQKDAARNLGRFIPALRGLAW